MFPKSIFWRLIAYTSIGTLCALALIWFFIPSDPDTPTLPDELLLLSQARLENAQTEDIWQYNTDHADRMLPDPEGNTRLAAIAREELKKSEFARACLTIAKIPVPGLRDELYEEIFNEARASCATISWSALAIQNMENRAKAEHMTKDILQKWAACKDGASGIGQ